MAKKTNCVINGNTPKYRITRVVGKKMNENGKLVSIRKNFYGDSRKDAEAQVREYFRKKEEGIDGKGKYFGILADSWIRDFLIPETNLADRTKELYVGQWNRYVKSSDLYTLPLDEVSAGVLQNFYNNLNAPYSAIKAVHYTMKRFYKYLNYVGYAKDITGVLTIPKTKADKEKELAGPTVWTDEEIDLIMHNFDKADYRFRLKFLIILAYNTGCRIGELLGIKYSDIKDHTLTVNRQIIHRPVFKDGKQDGYELSVAALKTTSSYRRIPLNSIVVDALEEHQRWHKKEMRKKGYETEFIFTTDAGKNVDPKNVEHAVKRYYKRIGVPIKTFHTYRHTFGTNLCRLNVPIQIASKLLGHASINVTMKYYVHVPQYDRENAVELLAKDLSSRQVKEPEVLYMVPQEIKAAI